MANNSSESYDAVDTFTNCNEIKKLANKISLVDILSPNKEVACQLMELVARAKCLQEFELLPDGHLCFVNYTHDSSREESPEGAGQASVKT